MKKIIYISAIVSIMMSFTSCFEKIDNWYSETAAYDGRFVVATTCEEYDSDNTTIADGVETLIYNSAANSGNEIWLDMHVAGESVKGKFKVAGNPSSFTSNEEVKNINSATYLIDTDYGLAPFTPDYTDYFRVPTAAGQLNDGIQLYTRIHLEEGKIILKGATTIGGNTSDSLIIKAVMHHDYVQFISYQIPQNQWEDPDVPEFAWKVKDGSNTPADEDGWDEHWTLSGYRYTGFPEDM